MERFFYKSKVHGDYNFNNYSAGPRTHWVPWQQASAPETWGSKQKPAFPVERLVSLKLIYIYPVLENFKIQMVIMSMIG